MAAIAWRLAWRGVRRDWGRSACAVAGVAGAVGLLAWHVGLAWTLRGAGEEAARGATAPFSAWVTGVPMERGQSNGIEGSREQSKKVEERAEATMGRRRGGGGGGRAVPEGVVEALRGAEGVRRVVEVGTVGATLDVRPGGRVLQGPPFRVTLARLGEGGMPFEAGRLTEGRWPAEGDEAEVVANEELFGKRVPKPELGEVLPTVYAGGAAGVRVVGFYRMSTVVGAFPTMWGNGRAWEEAERLQRGGGEPTKRQNDEARGGGGRRGGAELVLVEMEGGGNVGAVGRALEGVEGCALYTTRAVAERFKSDAVKNVLGAMPLSLGMAAITAACLLASLLAIGVSAERRRIAVLRCVGMTRGGVARLAGCEWGAILAAGWVLGTLGAWAALQAFLWGERGTAGMPSVARMGGVAWGCGAALAGLVGAVGTAWPLKTALGVRPLEAAGREDERRQIERGAGKGWLALGLLLPLPVFSMAGGLPGAVKTGLALGVGLPCFAAAMWMGAGWAARAAEAVGARLLGAVLRLDARLLRRRIGREPRRVRGMVLTLAMGLGGFAAVHIWGGTLMASFVPSPEWPDAIVSFLPNGLSAEEAARAAECPGVAGGRALRVDCTQKALEPGRGAFEGREAPEGQVLFFGADPVAAFGGEEPLMRLRFVEGEREAAVEAMREGRGCVVVAMLARLAGLHAGDRIRAAGRELEVAGVVDLNWHLVTSRALVRTRFGNEAGGGGGAPARTIGMAFVSEEWVRGVTGNERTFFLWADMTEELRVLGGLAAAERLDGQLRAALGDEGRNAVQVHHRDEIADGTLAHGNDIIGTMARVPLWSLAVASTGLAALLVAGARSGRREFAAMRAAGMTRGQLARLLLGEGVLIALTAAGLGVVGGGLAGWSFTGLSGWMAGAGLAVRLVVPFGALAKGVAFTLAWCAGMAALPLRRIVRMVDG